MVEIISCILPDNSALKLQIRKHRNYSNVKWLSNILLTSQWITEDIMEEKRPFLELNGNASSTYQKLRDTVKAVTEGSL